ncbi:MAG: glycerol-3-phosphate dehydrogenase/oxidase [Candidatus Omnitrophica bacterium]|nr:glycerol-3-phosphate dehydrogenase/oxidase [Candidatus Omnitrophota bacterium]
MSPYDLLIIGGGINGCALANMAAQRGLKVCLVDKSDFSSGTSSKSTKLMHGGIRYLEQGDITLVREALEERYVHCQSVPHLVKPLEFVIPVYERDPRPLWMMKAGVALYDFLAGGHRLGLHRFLNPKEALQVLPGLKSRGLTGAVSYYDAQMDDARLCLENALMAASRGAVLKNYVTVDSFDKKDGKVVGVNARDVLSGERFEILARRIVVAVGPWTNELKKMDFVQGQHKIRTTKGVHLVYAKNLSDKALLLQVQQDQRIFFVIPWKGQSLVGTTDTDFSGRVEDAQPAAADIDYLFSELRRVFPDEPFQKEKIVTTFAGLRPLVYASGHPSKVSRRHVIEESFSGVIYVMGGKYTTYRRIAGECLAKVLGEKKWQPTPEYPLFGSGSINEDSFELSRHYGIDRATIEYLESLYGTRYRNVLDLTVDQPSLKKKICTCSLAIEAQIVYSIRVEMAKTAEDIMGRRVGLRYQKCDTKRCQQVIEKYIAQGIPV